MSGRRGSLEAVETRLFGFRLSPFGRSVERVPRPSFVRGQTLERLDEKEREKERDGPTKERGEGEAERKEGPPPRLTMQPDLWAGRAYVELHTIS